MTGQQNVTDPPLRRSLHNVCAHGYSTPDDLHDVVCCMCSASPCAAVTVTDMRDHRLWELEVAAARHRREIDHVLRFGREIENPFDVTSSEHQSTGIEASR